jgi:hypothetical protein
MKKFLRALIIFLVPVLILVSVTEILLRKIPNDYLYKRNYLDQHSKSIKVLFLGNSHVYYGINPEYIHPQSFNAAYVSQSFNYDMDILKRYENKWDSLQYIVLALDYPSLYGRLEKGTEAWRIKNYSIYYDINSSINVADQTEVCNNSLKMVFARVSNYYIKKTSAITSSALGWGNDYTSAHKKDIVLTGRSAAQRQKAYHWLPENITSLRSIVQFAKARNIALVFFTPPGYSTYVQNLDTNKLNEALQDALSVTGNYERAFYFDWLNDKDFVAGDYYDADHMNEFGTKKLSLKMDRVIDSLNAVRISLK